MASLVMEGCTDKVLELITEKLDPARLEKLIEWYFKRIGASSVDPPAKNESGKEGDADIVATFEPIKTIIYVQAKHHVGTTDAWAVEQIASYVENKELGREDGYTRIPWVISTALNFSTECRDKAKRHQVCLGACRELAPSKQESTTYEPSLVCKLLILGCRLLIPDRLLVSGRELATRMLEAGLTDLE